MIELRNVTKSYPTPNGRHYVFRDLCFSFPDDVSIGLIGPNGAGKSTLLRLLGGIDSPDSGRVVSNVNISWPVGLKSGMQSALTGRDNVKFVCRLYGAVGPAMTEKVRFVEEFAEIGKHFDLPVRTYSSGMRSRLAFGLSMAFDFDYYLIDEATAAGDPRFRRKCNELFRARLEQSNLIYVSHSMADIRDWCDVVVVVQNGHATLYEDVEAGIAAYQGPVDPAVDRQRRVALRRALRRRARVAAAAAGLVVVPPSAAAAMAAAGKKGSAPDADPSVAPSPRCDTDATQQADPRSVASVETADAK